MRTKEPVVSDLRSLLAVAGILVGMYPMLLNVAIAYNKNISLQQAEGLTFMLLLIPAIVFGALAGISPVRWDSNRKRSYFSIGVTLSLMTYLLVSWAWPGKDANSEMFGALLAIQALFTLPVLIGSAWKRLGLRFEFNGGTPRIGLVMDDD